MNNNIIVDKMYNEIVELVDDKEYLSEDEMDMIDEIVNEWVVRS